MESVAKPWNDNTALKYQHTPVVYDRHRPHDRAVYNRGAEQNNVKRIVSYEGCDGV